MAARVRSAHPQTEWWIVGQPDGHNSDGQFFKAAAKRRLLGALRWMETFPSERMPGLFDLVQDSGGAVVSTSRHELFGLAIAEAMARGCAVVVPKHGPFPEFIADDVEGPTLQTRLSHRWRPEDRGSTPRCGKQAASGSGGTPAGTGSIFTRSSFTPPG